MYTWGKRMCYYAFINMNICLIMSDVSGIVNDSKKNTRTSNRLHSPLKFSPSTAIKMKKDFAILEN